MSRKCTKRQSLIKLSSQHVVFLAEIKPVQIEDLRKKKRVLITQLC